MTIDLNGYPNPGDTFTLAFKPTGLGNPFDNASDWYSAVAGNPNIQVDNVSFNSNVFGINNEIDVTVTLLADAAALSYGDIGALFTGQLNTFLYGYTLIGGVTGSASELPNTTTSPLDSSKLWWIAAGLIMVGIAFMFVKGEIEHA